MLPVVIPFIPLSILQPVLANRDRFDILRGRWLRHSFRFETGLLHDRYFIISRVNYLPPRQFLIEEICDDGKIRRVADGTDYCSFAQSKYDSLSEALKKLAKIVNGE